jgi:hypothetical protein
LDHLTLEQIQEWEAYDKIDPIGKWRDELGWASLEAQFTNLMTWAHAKRGTKHTAKDFMPDWEHDESKVMEIQSVDDMKKALKDIAKAQNKKGYVPTKPPKKEIK